MHGNQGVSTELKEAFRHADRMLFQQLFPDCHEFLFRAISSTHKSGVITLLVVRGWQRPIVDFSVWRNGEGIQQDKLTRDHIIGKTLPEMFTQIGTAERALLL